MYFIIKKDGQAYSSGSLPKRASEKSKKGELVVIDSDKMRFMGKSGVWGRILEANEGDKTAATNCMYAGGTIV